MRTNYLIYITMIAGMWLSACSEHDGGIPDKDAENISLSAVVDEVKIMSRTANDGAYTGTVPSNENNLEAAVWFSLTSGKYPNNPSDDTDLPIHTSINYVSGTATFPDDKSYTPKYPTSADPVYCVGFYPNDTGWTTNQDFSVATHTINGKQDLMFAPQISGNWNSHFQSQRFRHLLTWLKVCVCTTSPEAGSYWGKLTKISLKAVPQSLTIKLSKEEADDFNLKSAVEYSAQTQDLLIKNTTEEVELEIVSKEVASVFCPPIMEETDGKNKLKNKLKYKLYIECENGSATIDVELKALNDKEENTGESSSGPSDAELLAYPAGLQYVLTLFFHPFNVVEGVCTLNAWNAQNEDLYPNPSPTSNN